MSDEHILESKKMPPGVLKRLKEKTTEYGDYQRVSAKTGVPVGTLQKMMRGATEPKFGTVIQIASALGISLDYLMTGIGDDSGDWGTDMPLAPRGHTRVPIFEGGVSAGAGGVVFEGKPVDYQSFPTDMLKNMGKPEEMHLVPIVGDSMEPELRSGDHAMVDISQREPREQIFAFNMEGFAMVKRLRLKGGGKAELVSTNPTYEPIPVDLDNDSVIVGRVVWTGRRL